MDIPVHAKVVPGKKGEDAHTGRIGQTSPVNPNGVLKIYLLMGFLIILDTATRIAMMQDTPGARHDR